MQRAGFVKENQLLRKGYVHKDTVKRFLDRGYAAAKLNRFTSDWRAEHASINKDIRTDKTNVDARANDLQKNNPYIHGFYLDHRANIIGPKGPTLQVRAKDPGGQEDKFACDLIESEFKKWCQREFCTMAGRLNFVRVQWLLANQFHRNGEILVRKVLNAPNKYGFSLQLLEPDAVDTTYNAELLSGNVVIMGVEIDEWKRPVAYYLKSRKVKYELAGVWGYGYNNSSRGNSYGLERVPADEIIFDFDPMHTNQQRGMSSLAASMLTIHNLQGYDEAAIMAARAGAAKMLFLRDSDGSAPEEYDGDDVDDDGNELTDITPGTIEDIGSKQIEKWDPTYPHGEYPSFRKEHLREIAADQGRNYNSFAGDLEGVSFSSLRGGELAQRQIWMVTQELFIEVFNRQVYLAWLKEALPNGAINLPYSKYEKFAEHEWQPVRWPWVDPKKDVEAAAMEIKWGLSTRTDKLAMQGKDFNNVVQTLGKEKKAAEDAKINIEGDNNGKVQAGGDPQKTDGSNTNPSNNSSGKKNGGRGEEDGGVPGLFRISG